MCVFGNAVENYYDVIFMNESSEKINFLKKHTREHEKRRGGDLSSLPKKLKLIAMR